MTLKQNNEFLWNSRIAGDTHVGLSRSSNEDSFIQIKQDWKDVIIAGVADGMGGHEFGEVASFLVMKYFISTWNENKEALASEDAAVHFMDEALQTANKHIYHVNKELNIRWCMGTTATIGVFYNKTLLIAHIGDSRCYAFRKGKLQLLTTDQNWCEEMVSSGKLTEEEANEHPLSNMLTNCVGALPTLSIEYSSHPVHPGDRIIFCSDGLSSMIPDSLIEEQVSESKHPADAVDNLIKHALIGGGSDNVTVVAAYF